MSSSSSSSSSTEHQQPPPTPIGKSEVGSTPEFRSRALSAIDAPPLSSEQQKLFNDFKIRLKSKLPDDKSSDYTYQRFLRARKYNIDQAFEMYLAYVQWRKDANVDDILINPPIHIRELLARIVPESFHKFDKYGLPAYYMKAGAVNVELLLQFVPLEDMVRTHIWGMEYSFQRAAESSEKHGRNIDRFVNIVDLNGLSMGHRAAMKYIKHIAKLDNNYYPEALGKTYVINAPWVFPALWKIISPWIDPVTREKIHVLGSDYKKLLQERFDLNDLPEEYGGKCRCEGGCIKMYTDNEVKQYIDDLEKKLNLEQQSIPAGKSHIIELKAGEYGATFEYYIKTNSGEIGFHALFKYSDKTKGEKIWLPHTKFAGNTPNKGTFVTDYPGTAIFIFDNKHSWYTSETVFYHFNTIEGIEGIKKEFHSGHEQDETH